MRTSQSRICHAFVQQLHPYPRKALKRFPFAHWDSTTQDLSSIPGVLSNHSAHKNACFDTSVPIKNTPFKLSRRGKYLKRRSWAFNSIHPGGVSTEEYVTRAPRGIIQLGKRNRSNSQPCYVRSRIIETTFSLLGRQVERFPAHRPTAGLGACSIWDVVQLLYVYKLHISLNRVNQLPLDYDQQLPVKRHAGLCYYKIGSEVHRRHRTAHRERAVQTSSVTHGGGRLTAADCRGLR
jgi:hypothetical protein